MAEPASDKNTRARIRDAAIELIATKGYGVSVRAIAESASVSLGLINHHFGSKDGLRLVCDDHVLNQIVNAKETNLRGGAIAAISALGQMDEYAVPVAYCLRALQAGGAAAQRIVDHFVTDSMRWVEQAIADGLMRPSVNEEARIKLLTIQGFGAMQLYLTLKMGQAEAELTPREITGLLEQWLADYGLVLVEMYTHGVFANSEIFDAYRAAENGTAGTSSLDETLQET
ncbi:TetR family transcriptional regulator [Citricoccus sp. GCM10030269]|uniref:TetR family transcriptional regulator n=1 Tax=Citricoccus sp. GCM10030269 TaxID=3273388 RepID=UPI00360D723D